MKYIIIAAVILCSCGSKKPPKRYSNTLEVHDTTYILPGGDSLTIRSNSAGPVEWAGFTIGVHPTDTVPVRVEPLQDSARYDRKYFLRPAAEDSGFYNPSQFEIFTVDTGLISQIQITGSTTTIFMENTDSTESWIQRDDSSGTWKMSEHPEAAIELLFQYWMECGHPYIGDLKTKLNSVSDSVSMKNKRL